MKEICVITPPDAAYGFRLSGISQRVAEPAGLGETLEQAMAEPANGLLIIDERLLKRMPGERLREMERRWRGILLVLPSPVEAPVEAEDYAAKLIRRAIGYHVRLKL
jgi:V/A-type H+/Na+-transporting ATPase subunit F